MRTRAITAAAALCAAAAVQLPTPPASAEVVTFTSHDRFTESFSDESVICQTELYLVTVEGRTVTH